MHELQRSASSAAAMPPALLAGRWDGALLAPLAEINELLLDILRSAAGATGADAAGSLAGTTCPTGAASAARPRLLSELREQWRALEPGAQRRLARCPLLLLDAGFATPERWRSLSLEAGVMDGAATRSMFAHERGVALLRRALVFGWHLARSNRLGARVLLGMSAACAETIAATALRDLEAVAEWSPLWIVPRWQGQPLIWRQMLQAAVNAQEAALRRVQLRAVQLLAAGA